jgi:hypothetical protein
MMNDKTLKALPGPVCDIVLKGGITSGIVYPLALVRLAEKYRFSCIGGTSAGAIAAAACAAAEYGRRNGRDGFARLKVLPGEMGTKLITMFQPTPNLKPVYEIFIAALNAKSKPGALLAGSWAAITGYSGRAIAGIVPGAALIIAALGSNNLAALVLGALLALLGLIGAIGWSLARAMLTELKENDYGLCPGIQQPGSKDEGFTDWLARLIDEAAGGERSDKAANSRKTNDPLTFGDLANVKDEGAPIKLAMMTTSLMEMRPYTLPILSARELKAQAQSTPEQPQVAQPRTGEKAIHNIFIFERGEWAKLFPTRVVDYLVANCDPFKQQHGEVGEFYYFPDQTHLPLVVAARMSLSFPGLICAVPLWRRDFTLKDDLKTQLQRCLFSDGGLSSNFPIHFFDHLLPNRPTFAITLDEYDERRNTTRDENDEGRKTARVWFPLTADSGSLIPVAPFAGLTGFLMRLIDSAKNWPDSLQSVLPGYRERIVHVSLKPEEGGLNLTMDPTTIDRLAGYGKDAGDKLCGFDLNLHRWRRFLVAMARMEETLDEVADAYFEAKGAWSISPISSPATDKPQKIANRRAQIITSRRSQSLRPCSLAGRSSQSSAGNGSRGRESAMATSRSRRRTFASPLSRSSPHPGYSQPRVWRKPAWQPQGRRTGAREAGTSVDAARMWAAR